ncbi:MAG TPA: ABC transporter substrate-binding protein [Candidatus Rifleibacterium sp.]|nr:ABC transporter substrate-binding protein [Candidatus Rifleibacterium sp.]HPT47545.1 ABC transporter substrate-binding protein [Candidatus Rifleibacterium sp.]
MKERTLIIIAVIAYFALVFVGWDDSIATSPDGRTILTFWHTYNDPEEVILREIIKKWETANPKFTVRPVRIPFDGHKPKLRTALTVGQGPDMARVDWSFVCELARKNAVVDLGTQGFETIRAQYLPAAIGSCNIGGKYYGLPDQSNCVAMFYNRQMFREAGLLPLKPEIASETDEAVAQEFATVLPKTWEEFIEVGKKLTNESKGQYAFAMMNTLWWNLVFFNTYGARIISEDGTKCLLDSEAAVQAVEMMASLFITHKVEAGAWRPGAISPEQGFVNGKYAMILMGPWNLSKFKNTNIDFGVGLIPGGSAGTSTNVGGTDVVIFKGSKHVEACYRFLTFFTNAENQVRWCTALNQLPINLGAYDLVKFEDKHLMTFMEQMKHAGSNPVVKDFGLLEDLVNPEIEAVLSGQKNAKDALGSAAKKVQERLLDS